MRILASRHQGCRRSNLLQDLDNAEDEILMASPKGKILSKNCLDQDVTHSEFLISQYTFLLSLHINWFHHFYKNFMQCWGIFDHKHVISGIDRSKAIS